MALCEFNLINLTRDGSNTNISWCIEVPGLAECRPLDISALRKRTLEAEFPLSCVRRMTPFPPHLLVFYSG